MTTRRARQVEGGIASHTPRIVRSLPLLVWTVTIPDHWKTNVNWGFGISLQGAEAVLQKYRNAADSYA